jgi:hypothetical protein
MELRPNNLIFDDAFPLEGRSRPPRFLLKDESLEDTANLPRPDVIAAEIVEDLQAALAQFAEIASDLKTRE